VRSDYRASNPENLKIKTIYPRSVWALRKKATSCCSHSWNFTIPEFTFPELPWQPNDLGLFSKYQQISLGFSHSLISKILPLLFLLILDYELLDCDSYIILIKSPSWKSRFKSNFQYGTDPDFTFPASRYSQSFVMWYLLPYNRKQ
jgi:hypothetical protein